MNSLQQRFTSAFNNIAMLNEMLADFYISEYWDNNTNDFDWVQIDENVVKEIEKDSQFQSSF
jgi:hypothetical protein